MVPITGHRYLNKICLATISGRLPTSNLGNVLNTDFYSTKKIPNLDLRYANNLDLLTCLFVVENIIQLKNFLIVILVGLTFLRRNIF